MILTTLLAVSFQVATSAPGSYSQSLAPANGTIEMATRAQRLVSPGKPDIWLVGAVHVGTPQYYGKIQKLLDQQDMVLYEGVKRAEATNVPMKPGAQAPKSIYKVLSDAIGLDFQLNDIDYSKPNWSDVDLTWDKIAALNKEASHGKPTEIDTISKMFDPNSKTVQMFTTLISGSTPGMREAFKIMMVKSIAGGTGPQLDPTTSQIVVTARNQVVLDKIKEILAQPKPPKSIGVFYGAMHLPGMEKSLTESYGYKEADKQWLTSATADPKKLDDTGKQILASFEKMGKQVPAIPDPAKP